MEHLSTVSVPGSKMADEEVSKAEAEEEAMTDLEIPDHNQQTNPSQDTPSQTKNLGS